MKLLDAFKKALKAREKDEFPNLVVALTQNEYQTFISQNGLDPSKYRYIYDAKQLRGIRNCNLHFCGRWWKINGLQEIMDEIRTMRMRAISIEERIRT